MTAYARAEELSSLGRVSCELSSLNRKHLEIKFQIPRELQRLEPLLRKKIASRLRRGTLSVSFHLKLENLSLLEVKPNFSLLKELKTAWEALAASQSIELKDEEFLHLVSQEKSLLLYEEAPLSKDLDELLFSALDKAMLKLMEAKEQEGEAMLQDMRSHLEQVERGLCFVSENRSLSSAAQYKKLKARLQNLENIDFEEERLLRELAIYADKADISEEIARFSHHLESFYRFLEEKEEAIGKNLDFLLQELGRESNTMAAKSVDVSLTSQILQIKANLEKVREQVQNIE